MGLSPAPWHRNEIRLAATILLGVAALFALAGGASAIVDGRTLAFDRAVLLALRQTGDLGTPIGPGWLESAMVQITALGSIPVLSLIALLTVAYLAVARKPALALFTGLAMAGGALLAAGIKLAYARPRPDVVPHLVPTNSSSFPSEHSADSAVVYLTIAALVACSGTARAQTGYVTVAACALTLLIGFSRLYLGVHYPTDVMAGWLVGAFWAGAMWLVMRRLPPGVR